MDKLTFLQRNGWLFCVLSIILILFMVMFNYAPDRHAIQLADAICLEKYGTHFKDFEPPQSGVIDKIEGIYCKTPVKKQDIFDGLIVTIK